MAASNVLIGEHGTPELEHRVSAATKRKRASTPRSKNGCATCRQRRVKCDERRPVCQRCTKAEFTCTYSGGTAHQPLAPQDVVSSALAALPVAVYKLPFSVPGSPDERKALHYYHNHAAMNLSGFVTIGFWNRFVLERCQVEPVVRHSIIALCQAHLEYGTQDTLVSFSDSSLRAYCKAIRRLRKFIEDQAKPSRIVVLLCCIVFMTLTRFGVKTSPLVRTSIMAYRFCVLGSRSSRITPPPVACAISKTPVIS